MTIRSWFQPNSSLVGQSFLILLICQYVLLLGLWSLSQIPFLPTPIGISQGWLHLMDEGMAGDLAASLMLYLEAIGISLVVSLVISYASVMPFFRTIANLYTKLRYLSLVGLTLVFTVMTSGAYSLKLSLLVFGMSTWMVTSLMEEIRCIPQEEYEHARTLRLSEWQVVLEVVIIGKLDRVVETLRQNTAIIWLMLTTVEGLVRSAGGIGAVLVVQSKYLHMNEVFAIQLTIFFLAYAMDWGWRFMKTFLFPYADLSVERK